MDYLFATNNLHKLEEVRAVFAGTEVTILSLADVGCTHETVEDGETFYDNALKKAQEICRLTGYPTLADDTGLCVDALGGRPGVYSNRFAPKGLHCDRLLEAMNGIENRQAQFITAALCVLPDGRSLGAEGQVKGRITLTKRGDYDFGYDRVFYVDECGKTFGEMTIQEKNRISHRSRAFSYLMTLLKQEGVLTEDRT